MIVLIMAALATIRRRRYASGSRSQKKALRPLVAIMLFVEAQGVIQKQLHGFSAGASDMAAAFESIE